MSREAIENIVREMREAESVWHRSDIAELPTQYLKEWADCIDTAMNDATKLSEENERLRDALNDAIQLACMKCTIWNSRADRCSLGSGMCDQVLKWKQILWEVSK